jgi:hypothetical protein
MNVLMALVNLAVGLGYVGIGTLALIDLVKGWRRWGYSHFGGGFVGIAFTCGPHHLAHALHTGLEGRSAGPLDAISVMVGLPAAATFVLLRLEAFRGGRGDRLITGTPPWLSALPTAAGVYVTAMVAAGLGVARDSDLALSSVPVANLALMAVYVTIGYFLLRTQIRNRALLGGWSVSGLSMMGVFTTCSVMHAAFTLYSVTGRYHFDPHGFWIDWIGVPFGLYFLWCVRALYRGSLVDWNRAPAAGGEPSPAATVPAAAG